MPVKKKVETKQEKGITISAPNMQMLQVDITGINYVQLRFSQKAKEMMRKKHEGGSTSKKGAKRDKRNFKTDFEDALYISDEGWHGIPASAFRNAMISACRIVGFQMTKAKLALFVVADGLDKYDNKPLIKIVGKPEMHIDHVRNATGVVDLRVRGLWKKWKASPLIRYDADMFTAPDIVNLMARVGYQVGIGEGRPDSKASAGMGWGLFDLVTDSRKKKVA